MTEEKHFPAEDTEEENPDQNKKQWKLNSLILAGVFALSVLLPAEYKAFAPLLFLVPFIIKVTNKFRQSGESPEHPSTDPPYNPSMPEDRTTLSDPYSYKPKDPKDPRKYKPIG
jgi:hypothetical protein